MTQPVAVQADGLVKTYGSLVAVDHVDLTVGVGEVYGLLGPNGAGKTTFLQMLFGLVRPDEGTLTVLGRTWAKDGPRALQGVAGFLESPKFYPYLSGRKNLELLARLDGDGALNRIDAVLDTVELTGREQDKVRGYSFGMRQRLGVAAALVRDPSLLVLDEPANGLDPAGIRDMRALVSRLAERGLTVLLSSHNMGEVEEICDNVTIMKAGAVAYHGTIAALRERAPEPAHLVRTSDDAAARTLAAAHPVLTVTPRPDGAGLDVRGAQRELDCYVRELVTGGLSLRALYLAQAPLESLFFLLTECDPESESGSGSAGAVAEPVAASG